MYIPQHRQGQEPPHFQAQARELGGHGEDEEGQHASLINPTTLSTMPPHHVHPIPFGYSTQSTQNIRHVHPPPTVEQNMAFQAFRSEQQLGSRKEEDAEDTDMG